MGPYQEARRMVNRTNASRDVASITRRSMIRLGGLGLGVPSLLRLWQAQSVARAASPGSVGGGHPKPIRACILIFYYGGPSHFETYDPKPDAPAEVRGEFKSIPTSAPGVFVSE